MKREIDELLNQVRLLHNRIVQVGEAVHAEEPVTLGMRAVLEYLSANGPATVPDIARSRSVTRQHIQMLVNGLLDEALVRLEENPAHKRSSLVALTADGDRLIRRLRQREARLLDETDFRATRDEIRRATRTLEKIRTGFQTKGKER